MLFAKRDAVYWRTCQSWARQAMEKEWTQIYCATLHHHHLSSSTFDNAFNKLLSTRTTEFRLLKKDLIVMSRQADPCIQFQNDALPLNAAWKYVTASQMTGIQIHVKAKSCQWLLVYMQVYRSVHEIFGWSYDPRCRYPSEQYIRHQFGCFIITRHAVTFWINVNLIGSIHYHPLPYRGSRCLFHCSVNITPPAIGNFKVLSNHLHIKQIHV